MNKSIEIHTAVATLIEPGKKYIIQISRESGLSFHDGQMINDRIKQWGAEGITVVYDNKPLEVIEIHE